MIVLTNLVMNAIKVKKLAFLKEASDFFKNASFYADEGDLQLSAGLILKVLDQAKGSLC